MERSQDPDILYHYTSQRGLLGILDSEKLTLRATSIFHLNDASEAEMFSMLESECARRRRTDDYADERSMLFRLFSYELLGPDRYPPAYVVAFSACDDDLSQWRGYCPEGAGYAIGFGYEALGRFAEANDCELVQCEYVDTKKPEELLKDELDQMESEFLRAVEHERSKYREEGIDPASSSECIEAVSAKASVAVGRAATRLGMLFSRIRNESFQAEREWRIVFVSQGRPP